MGRPLRALIIADDESQCDLLLRALRSGGFDVDHERVASQPAMTRALATRSWDVVLSPALRSTRATELAHEINNPLAAVLANVELVLRGLTDALHRHGVGDAVPDAAARWIANELPAFVESLRDAHDATMRVREVANELEASARTDGAHRGPSRARDDGRRARILVVDDDGLVGTALARILARDHEVVTLTSAREAYARLVRGEAFEIVFCDVLMPELTGIELYEALLDAAPDMAARMVFMTGGAFSPAARDFLDRVRQPRIDKPFDVAEVRALVRELVG